LQARFVNKKLSSYLVLFLTPFFKGLLSLIVQLFSNRRLLPICPVDCIKWYTTKCWGTVIILWQRL